MLGESIFTFFEGIGALGLIIAFSIISFLDGLAIPTIPEVWLLLIAMTDVAVPQVTWAVLLVVIGTFSALAAQILLFLLVRRFKLPRRIEKIMNRYTKFLIISDEKLAFVNWLAPVIPFTGAFIATCNWKPRLAFTYSFFGGITKMSIIVLLASAFPLLVDADIAANASLALVIAVLGVSLIITYIRRRSIMGKIEGQSGLDSCEIPPDKEK